MNKTVLPMGIIYVILGFIGPATTEQSHWDTQYFIILAVGMIFLAIWAAWNDLRKRLPNGK